jgi:hypothetical protein
MVPSASPIAILVNPTNPDTEDEAKDIQDAAQRQLANGNRNFIIKSPHFLLGRLRHCALGRGVRCGKVPGPSSSCGGSGALRCLRGKPGTPRRLIISHAVTRPMKSGASRRSPANRLRKRSAGRLHVRRPPERSRWPANAAHHTRNASACSVAIRTLSGCHGLGM